MANKKLTPLEILYREFKNAKTDAARNDAWRRFETKRGEMYPARTDRRSAMLRDSAAVAARFPEKVLGGENHRYYEPGRRIRMTVDETARRSPDVWVDPESGERYVRAFHYTQPENIENILKTGLAARLGPDAKNFQNRAGVWTSMGDANPMGYDYVNNAYVGDKNYRMDPLEIRIPEEEWKSMVVDHTGKTGDDQVMVFRDSPSKPYGTVDINGEKVPVVIPPEYISRYEFPKDWETDYQTSGKTLWGYAPNKRMAPVTDRGFVKSIPENVLDEAKSILGEDATNNQISQWAVDNRQKELKDYFLSNGYPNLYGSLSQVNFKEQKLPSSRTKNGNFEDGIIASNMKKSAQRQWFEGTDFKNPYEYAVGTENPPKPSEGFIGKAYSDHKVFPTYEAEPTRTKEFLVKSFGDRYPIRRFANTNNEYLYPKENFAFPKNNYKKDHYSVYDYLDLAGVRDIGQGKNYGRDEDYIRIRFNSVKEPNLNRDQLKREIRTWNSNFYNNAYKNDEKYRNLMESFMDAQGDDEAHRALYDLEKYRAELMTPEMKKKRQEYVLGRNEPKVYKKYDIADRARELAEFRAVGHNDKSNVDAYYTKALQEVREEILEDWKKQFMQDSLNRVYGHELGRKVGKYRASRGKPVNPKQL